MVKLIGTRIRCLGLVLTIASAGFSASALGNITQPAPVEDLSSGSAVQGPNTAVKMPEPLTLKQRVARLQQQMNNLISMNLPQQISQLRQTLQKIQGQLQVQQHQAKLLGQRQKSFYTDMEQQIQQLKGKARAGDAVFNSHDNAAMQASDQLTEAPVEMPVKNIKNEEVRAYRSAFNLLMNKQYDEAKTAFEKYLDGYPKGQFVPNAQYWLGEIYLLQKDYSRADQAFSTVIKDYPQSGKVLDAKLKLAIIKVKQGKLEEAKQAFSKIKKEYPNTTAAYLADVQLRQLAAGIKPDQP